MVHYFLVTHMFTVLVHEPIYLNKILTNVKIYAHLVLKRYSITMCRLLGIIAYALPSTDSKS